MNLDKKLISILLLAICLMILPFSAFGEDFPYALTESDLPDGFTLSSTTGETEKTISQTWKTPSDSLGATLLSVTDYENKSSIDQLWLGFALFDSSAITVSGADKARNVSVLGINSYYVAIDTYVIQASDFITDYDDIETLFEAQVNKISGGSGGGKSPGFSLVIGLFSLSIAVILIKKKRNLKKY